LDAGGEALFFTLINAISTRIHAVLTLCSRCFRDKAESFLKYARLYPEYQFIFFGDNGQGDVFAAEVRVPKIEQTQSIQGNNHAAE
jgi:hypothetical protein